MLTPPDDHRAPKALLQNLGSDSRHIVTDAKRSAVLRGSIARLWASTCTGANERQWLRKTNGRSNKYSPHAVRWESYFLLRYHLRRLPGDNLQRHVGLRGMGQAPQVCRFNRNDCCSGICGLPEILDLALIFKLGHYQHTDGLDNFS